ncbi:unnamed protein product [Owenia fusiformis]|uniref:gamma-glutamylcyclotransferase n=1 Tax=Owenia fusiformis TaxID=6347 RepID=A0A8J1TDM0_OWEFU|nr:unnamed protein product [Owenia fusiformis]
MNCTRKIKQHTALLWKFNQFTCMLRTHNRNMAKEGIWSFGFGSNMDVIALENKKHVKVLDHVCAILKGYRLSFNVRAFECVEPAYAGIERGSETDEVHGVAFCGTKESMEELDRTEAGYDKKEETFHGYDGRVIKGFVYLTKPGSVKPEVPPSSRYVGVLLKGARQAGLKQEYIDALTARPTYTPTAETLAKRAALPPLDSLPAVTVAELAKHDGSDPDLPIQAAALGYVFEVKMKVFKSHYARDITTRMLNQFHGIPMDDNDDKGHPPYPIESDLPKEALEYITRWRDQYLSRADNKVIGHVKEYLEQQKSGKSEFKLPAIPT